MVDNRLVGGVLIPLTPQEQADLDAEIIASDAEEASRIDPDNIAENAIISEFESSPIRKLMFETILDLINRIRVLEGNAILDRSVVRENLRQQLKSL